MKRRRFLAALGAGGLSLSAGPLVARKSAERHSIRPPCTTAGGTKRYPNIVILIADDLGGTTSATMVWRSAPRTSTGWQPKVRAWSGTMFTRRVHPPGQDC